MTQSGSVSKRHVRLGESLGLFAGGVSLLLFAWLGYLVLQPTTAPFDLHIRTWVHGLSSPGLTIVFALASQVGSWFVLLSVGILLAILFLNNRFADVRMMTIALYGAIVLSAALKLAFHVLRPEPFFGLTTPTTHSFPSAHAMVSLCFFSSIAGIIGKLTQSRFLRSCAWGLAGLLIALIGLSRVYLGVQYPT